MFKDVGLVGSSHLCPMTGQCELLYLLYLLYHSSRYGGMYLYPYNTDNNTPVSYLGPIVIRSHSSIKVDWTTKKELSSNHQIRNSLNSYTPVQDTYRPGYVYAGGWIPLGMNFAETAEKQLLSREAHSHTPPSGTKMTFNQFGSRRLDLKDSRIRIKR